MDATTPHTEIALQAAIAALPRPVSVRAAALHLALPRDVAASIAVRTSGEWATYRGREVLLSGDPIADAARIAAAGHRDGDRYLDLAADVRTWVKVIRSGVRRIVFGTDTLLGAPLLALGSGVPETAAVELLAQWESDGVAPGLVDLQSGTYQLVGTSTGYALQEAVAARQEVRRAVADADVDRAASGVVEDLLGELKEVELVDVNEKAAEVDVTVRLDGEWEAVVPVHVTPSSEVVGISTSDVLDAAEERLPVGWTWKGRTVGGSMVGQHRSSLTIALLARV